MKTKNKIIITIFVFVISVIVLLAYYRKPVDHGVRDIGQACTRNTECKEYPSNGCNPTTHICDSRYVSAGSVCSANSQCLDDDLYACQNNACVLKKGMPPGGQCRKSQECMGFPGQVGCINFTCTEGINDGCPAGKVACGGKLESDPIICCGGT